MNTGRYLLAAIAGSMWSATVLGAGGNDASDLEQITVYAPQPNGTSLGGAAQLRIIGPFGATAAAALA